jgi:hypothetical protein
MARLEPDRLTTSPITGSAAPSPTDCATAASALARASPRERARRIGRKRMCRIPASEERAFYIDALISIKIE